jgi:hypothetical protein
MQHRTSLVFVLVVAICAAFEAVTARQADASQLIDRNATAVSLAVNARGEALVSYRAAGVLHHVLAWGAVNAVTPAPGTTQVAFRLDYAGGFGKYRDAGYWKRFGIGCARYTGPPIAWKVAACAAPDGSFWALQAWQRGLPDYGARPTAAESAWELRLSHWSGAPAELQIGVDWAYRRFDHLFGTYTYDGKPVYGFKATPRGTPLDSFGRNVYLDTFDSAYAGGWRRENSFLTHRPSGAFCYGFFPHGDRPAGKGTFYRATVIGPGVTPDVMWLGHAPGAYNNELDAVQNRQIAAMGDPACKPN